ncbi:MAG: sigma-70 family RNA polymerase sigma factor, partial [Oscillospiraceae bacterium]
FILKEKGDEQARNKLIEHNLRLVAHISKKYYSKTNDQDDLISIGTIGLIKAVNTFNLDKGIRFSTYAARCIENEILMHFRVIKKSAGDVYFPENADSDTENSILNSSDCFGDEDELIDNLDLKIKTEKLYSNIDKFLNEREKEIIKYRYGLYGVTPLTQKEVAKKLNISRSYVSRIEKKSLENLRKIF